jgi:SAM-dependent methyltransferase
MSIVDHPLTEAPEAALKRFLEMAEHDCKQIEGSDDIYRWLFIDRKLARGEATDLNFYGFDGKGHVGKFFNWIRGFRYADYFDNAIIAPLAALSARRDEAIFHTLGLNASPEVLRNIGRYNAQDYIYQRMYPVPDRQKLRKILDFGAGHGRSANLTFGAENSDTDLMIAVDSIPASYLTQRVYYAALRCRVFDYMDHRDLTREDFVDICADYDIIHLPTWRMDLIPDNFLDMVCCVQVLREIPQRLFLNLVGNFWRVLHAGGAFYIRDSNELHNPNQLPQDLIISSSGFLLEFYPRVINLKDIHGIPRIWRKFDPEIFISS